MRYRFLLAAIASAVGAAAACSSGSVQQLGEDTAPQVDSGGTILGPDNQPAPTGPAGSGLATGLPCDVQALLENRCIGCHDGKTTGAPRLLDYADLTAPSRADPKQSMAAIALLRMQSPSSPMPPAPAVPPDAEEIKSMADWVMAGTPKGALCTDTPDGGTEAGSDAGDAGVDGGGCSSGVRWSNGDNGSPSMHPGMACSDCHQKKGGPNLRFGGTVYRAPHDVDDCNGAAPPPTLTVEVTDKLGRKLSATVNAAGNFELERKGGQQFSAPFRAKVIDGAKTRSMAGAVTSGDCNSCHTAAGASSAPGRILAP